MSDLLGVAILNLNSISVFQGVPHFPTLLSRASKSSETEFKCLHSFICLTILSFIQQTGAEDLLRDRHCARLWDTMMDKTGRASTLMELIV